MAHKQTQAAKSSKGRPPTRNRSKRASSVLVDLLQDTSPHILVYLAEKYGLHRVPGLTKSDLIARILSKLSPDKLRLLKDELIAARYGAMSIDELLVLALEDGEMAPGKPRLDQVSPGEAILLEGNTQHWIYTMRGYDVKIDLQQRNLACDCPYFAFASRRGGLCKHLAMAFRLIPEVYAREALIDLLVWREYGNLPSSGWRFHSPRAA